MTATRQDIIEYLREGFAKGATHIIIACDTYDYSNYPVFVMPGQNSSKVIESITKQAMTSIDEVYNLSLDINKQLSEFRVRHEEPWNKQSKHFPWIENHV